MSIALIIVTAANIQSVIKLVMDSVTSEHTKRAYSRALTDFVLWHSSTGQQGFNKACSPWRLHALFCQQFWSKTLLLYLTYCVTYTILLS
jgi:hypothetical protein